MHPIIRLFTLGLVLILGGCAGGGAGQNLERYAAQKPALDLQQFFSGPVKAWGIVQDRNGNIVNRFDVDMVGTWDGNVGTLKEDFRYYDGKKDKRVWTIRKLPNNRYVGRFDEVIGQAKGDVRGYALRWDYMMNLPVGDKTYKVRFDDWMYLMNDDVLINRTDIKKFGITVAELTIVMQKQ